MILKVFGIDFHSYGGALTLDVSHVSDIGYQYEDSESIHEKTHPSGWTIKGKIHEDYFEWVNEFEAFHPTYGRVLGDFEKEVYADSEEGLKDFYTQHTPTEWDYGDI